MSRNVPSCKFQGSIVFIKVYFLMSECSIKYFVLLPRWHPILRNIGETWGHVINPVPIVVIMKCSIVVVGIFYSSTHDFTCIDYISDIGSEICTLIEACTMTHSFKINSPIGSEFAEVEILIYDVFHFIVEFNILCSVVKIYPFLRVIHACSYCWVLW